MMDDDVKPEPSHQSNGRVDQESLQDGSHGLNSGQDQAYGSAIHISDELEGSPDAIENPFNGKEDSMPPNGEQQEENSEQEPKESGIKDDDALATPQDETRALIDTAAPFESVKEAVSMFGGIVDWKAHKIKTVERRKVMEQDLEKVKEEIPIYKQQSMAAEEEKSRVLKELESTKRHVEELKLNLERAETEERQAKQDSDLAKLRLEEMEQGVTDEASVAAKAQLEVAKARHTAAISELESVKEEITNRRKDYSSLINERDAALKMADEAVFSSKEVEKSMEELTIELISTKEALESAHAAHLEADEQRIEAVTAKEEEARKWENDLKQAQEDLDHLNQQIHEKREVEDKLNLATDLLTGLKSELAAYMESKLENSTSEELEAVKLEIEKATDEVNCLKVAAVSLKNDLENEKSEIENLKQREKMASMTATSLELDLERIKTEIVVVQMREREAKERTLELALKLDHASQEANDAKSAVETAREAVKVAKEEAERARDGAGTIESRLLAARKEIEAAKATEKLAMDAIRALQESESKSEDMPSVTGCLDPLLDPPLGSDHVPVLLGSSDPDHDTGEVNGVTLSLEEYYTLTKRARNAEEQADADVATAEAQVAAARAAEAETMRKLEEASAELASRKEAHEEANHKAEKAKEGKLAVEHELRKWRAEGEQRRKARENAVQSPRTSIEKVADPSGPAPPTLGLKEIEKIADSSTIPLDYGQGLKHLEEVVDASPTLISTTPRVFKRHSTTSLSPKSEASVEALPELGATKRKKKSFFPRFFLFFSRRKAAGKTS